MTYQERLQAVALWMDQNRITAHELSPWVPTTRPILEGLFTSHSEVNEDLLGQVEQAIAEMIAEWAKEDRVSLGQFHITASTE